MIKSHTATEYDKCCTYIAAPEDFLLTVKPNGVFLNFTS